MKYTKTYLLPTANGYKRVKRRIGKRYAKKDHNLVAPILLVASIGLCLGLSWSTSVLQSVKAIDIKVSTQVVEEGVSDEQVMEQPVAGQTTPSLSEHQEIINYIVEVFGEDAPDAFNVLYCENRGLDPDAINYNKNGTTDHSIFQINSIHSARFGEGFMTDWKQNVDVAKQIFDEQGWTPWTCSHRVDVKSYLYY